MAAITAPADHPQSAGTLHDSNASVEAGKARLSSVTVSKSEIATQAVAAVANPPPTTSNSRAAQPVVDTKKIASSLNSVRRGMGRLQDVMGAVVEEGEREDTMKKRRKLTALKAALREEVAMRTEVGEAQDVRLRGQAC